MAFVYTWDGTFEAQPPDSQLAAQLGLRVRELKEAIRERMDIEHAFGSAGGARHKLPVVATATAAAALSDKVDGMLVGRSDLGAVFQRQSAAFVPMMGHKYGNASARSGFPSADLNDGFLWVDKDTLDHPIYVWDAVAGAFQSAATQRRAVVTWDHSTRATSFTIPSSGSPGAMAMTGGALAGECRVVVPDLDLNMLVVCVATIPVKGASGDPREVRFDLKLDTGAGASIVQFNEIALSREGKVGITLVYFVNAVKDKNYDFTLEGEADGTGTTACFASALGSGNCPADVWAAVLMRE